MLLIKGNEKMCDGIIIDGHVIKQFKNELVEEKGCIFDIINFIVAKCGIAINQVIENHWETHCGKKERALEFWEWYTTNCLQNRIHFIESKKINGKLWASIQAKFSIPTDPFVRAAIECANTTVIPRYIIAEDLYFYDPKAKRLDNTNQRKIIEKRNGCVCKYLEKYMQITVSTPEYCKGLLFSQKQGCNTQSITTDNNIQKCPLTVI